MLGWFIGGLVVGFAIGWAVRWILDRPLPKDVPLVEPEEWWQEPNEVAANWKPLPRRVPKKRPSRKKGTK